MIRSPHFYPLNRGMDADAGGAADLQTDVMRFMAIISLCLVAIFALVQSIPLAPLPEPPPAPEPEALVVAEAVPPPPPQATIELTRPEVSRPPQKSVETVALQRPVPRPAAKAPETTVRQRPADPVPTPVEPVEAAAPEVPEEQGFTLRFESERALTRLVEREVVGLYAISPAGTRRLRIGGENMSFWSASTPRQYHEMEAGTVPATVIAAYRRAGVSSDGAVKWGVAIPAGMAGQLDRYLAEFSGGSLVIGIDGAVRRED